MLQMGCECGKGKVEQWKQNWDKALMNESNKLKV